MEATALSASTHFDAPVPECIVCMATFNGEQFIREQMQSILGQLGPHDIIIVSDFQSSDATLLHIHSFGDSRIKLISFANTRLGEPAVAAYTKSWLITRNFEHAIKEASHWAQDKTIVCLADQDDIWLPDKVAKLKIAFQQSEAALVMHDAKVVDTQLKTLYPSYFRLKRTGTGLLRNIVNNGFLGCCMAFQGEMLAKILPFPADLIAHDVWIGLHLQRKGLYLLNEPLLLYRRHERSVTGPNQRASSKALTKISLRLHFLLSFLKARLRKMASV